jgi:oligoribonuclease (3'-5' exoribonuclease)
MKKFQKYLFIFLFLFILSFFCFFFVGKAKPAEKIEWGVVFSQKHSQLLGLDWRENYLEILDGLKVKNLKIITHWDLIEPKENEYFFEDLDWQIKEAEKRNAKIILVIGMKTGRWPECHIPEWLTQKSKVKSKNYEKEILDFIKTIVERYKNSKAIWAWQIENEPFFPFGECPKIEKNLVKREIELIKSLDLRPVIFTDSGEFSFWINAAKLGDIVGTTLHRKVYFKEAKRYITYPFPSIYYWRKAKLIDSLFHKKVIISELQAEPWCKNLIYNCDLDEQKITMDFEQFKKNIDFAKNTGIDTIYFWGVEWWYWMKKQGKPEIWEEAKHYFNPW